jgi:large subunit ribosomal protein L30
MANKTFKVTQTKSAFGQIANIRGSVKGLGLRRIGHTVEVEDSPATRGMVQKAIHLVKVEPSSEK